MPRAVVTGNGTLLAAMNKQNMLCDLYFPYVGMEAQIAYQHKHRIGVYVDNRFSWLYNNDWKHDIGYFMETLVTNSYATNENLKLEMTFNDFVYPSENAFIRKGERLDIPEKCPLNVLYIGRFSPEKNILSLIDACALAYNEQNPFKLSIVGFGFQIIGAV